MRGVPLAAKRVIDMVLSLVVLVFGWPLLVVIALLVKRSSPGPALFVQERVGKGQKPFSLYKFRTMTVAPRGYDPIHWDSAEEARVTRVGQFLRDYGLDELPQAINILKGDMSIVGPRPRRPVHVRDYDERQRKVFAMRPGVVCLASFQGRRSIPVEQRVELHVQYVENWSLRLDFEILLRAIPVVLGRRDAREVVVPEGEGS